MDSNGGRGLAADREINPYDNDRLKTRKVQSMLRDLSVLAAKVDDRPSSCSPLSTAGSGANALANFALAVVGVVKGRDELSSYLRLAYEKLADAGIAGTTGSLERRVVEGVRALGTFNGATVGELSGKGSYFRQLLDALNPRPVVSGGGYLHRIVDGGWPEFIRALNAALAGGGGGALLAQADFKNGAYQIAGSPATFDDMYAADTTNWAPFDPSDIVDGTGWVGTGASNTGLVLQSAFAADFIANGVTEVFTVNFTADVSGPASSPFSVLVAEMDDFPDFNQTLGMYLDSFEPLVRPNGTVFDGPGYGQHVIAKTTLGTTVTVSVNGMDVHSGTTTDAKIVNTIAMAPSYAVVERIDYYAPQDDAAIQALSANLVPHFTDLPTISGTTAVGQTLTCSTGTATNSPTSHSYQWEREATTIDGATDPTYVLQPGDLNGMMGCLVTATNANGHNAIVSTLAGPVTA